MDELKSIVDYGRFGVAIDSAWFPNASDWYWSSSPYVGDASRAWFVNFGDGIFGNVNYHDRNVTNAVRLVRASQ